MAAFLREGFATWRHMGARRGTAAATQMVVGGSLARARRAWLRRRPLRVSQEVLYAALGTRDLREALTGIVPSAMPTVAAFEHRLAAIAPDERAQLLTVAEQVAAHRFDLLGSGPTELGPRIDWSLDFKSGRRWPLEHISQLTLIYPDDSDVKLPWELSRFQHLPILAAAHRLTGERRWLDEIGAELQDWVAANPVEFGPNWACTMDVAIRAANWVATLALVAGPAADEPWFEQTLASLLLHGRFIRTHLEWAPVRSNHYLSDVVGLLCLAAVFSNGPEGRAWSGWAASEVAAELLHQVSADGCDHEASIPYHRLVAELFICGTQAADAPAPAAISDAERERLAKMLRFVADYTRPDELAPQVGDADDGRFLPLDDYGRADPRSHLHLFTQAGIDYRRADASAAYPQGGYWIMRGGDLYALIRCGDVGVGSHAHNDALSFELSLGGQPLVIDPGSYLYSADFAERNRFRSTAFHATLQIDGAEQNPIGADLGSLFRMADTRRAEALGWEAAGGHAVFTGRHHGYGLLDQPATHTRRLELSGEQAALLITDTVASAGAHDLRWTFPLAPCHAELVASGITASFPSGAVLEIEAAGLDFRIDEEWFSPSYGRRARTPFVRAHRRSAPGEDVTTITLRAHTGGGG